MPNKKTISSGDEFMHNSSFKGESDNACSASSASDVTPIKQLAKSAASSSDHVYPSTMMKTAETFATIQSMIMAHRHLDRAAVVYKDECYTYDQLITKSLALLNHMQMEYKIKAGDCVCLEMSKTAASVVALFACYLGRITVNAVDLRTPPAYRDYKVDTMKCVLSLRDEWATTPTSLPIVRVDVLLGNLGSERYPSLDENLLVDGDMSDILFIEWTSGSTGKPKAMAVQQEMMNHWLPWRQIKFPKTDDDQDITAMNLFWVWYWHIPLAAGSTLVIIPDEFILQPVEMVTYMIQKKVTRVDCLSPSLLAIIVEYCSQQLINSWTTLRIMYTSGEACPLSTAHSFFTKFDSAKVRLLNCMSTTETAADISFCDVRPWMLQHLSVNYPEFKMCPMFQDDLLVWNNDLFFNEEGSLVCRGRNVNSSGYATGEKKEAFWVDSQTKEPSVSIGDVGVTFSMKAPGGAERTYMMLTGRSDAVVKVRGFRVDMSGVESILLKLDGVIDAACVFVDDRILAVIETNDSSLNKSMMLVKARELLPEAHVPSDMFFVRTIPRNATGKRDRPAMVQMIKDGKISNRKDAGDNADAASSSQDPMQKSSEAQGGLKLPRNLDLDEVALKVYKVWTALLKQDLSAVSWDTSFFDVGGHSLLAVKLAAKLSINVTDIFSYPTMAGLSSLLRSKTGAVNSVPEPITQTKPSTAHNEPVYVVGMSGRFPGANSVPEFWKLISNGECGISNVKEARPGWVTRAGILDDDLVHGFDTDFWGMGKHEAQLTDPQHRVMMEVAYEALDDSGLLLRGAGSSSPPLDIGCYLACGQLPHHITDVLKMDLGALRSKNPQEYWKTECGNEKDYLATRISYKLNLVGPSEVIQSACSSSLLAVAKAVDAIRQGHCSAAVAGGVSICSPQEFAVKYEDGMVWAANGQCCPYDASAAGIVNANACGAVVLMSKTHYESLLAKSAIPASKAYAEVLGHAVNNDGRRKAAFYAPSIEGQRDVILGSLRAAGVKGSDVRYVEGHGTATPLGDPIEVEALSQALTHDSKGDADDAIITNCTIGSAKGNVGHANAAAGIVGMIKAILTCKHKTIAPTCNYSKRNPNIPESCPFNFIGGTATAALEAPHIVGVSSFGIGGTNAHMTLRSVDTVSDDQFAQIDDVAESDENENEANHNLLMFSGPTPESCRQQAKDVLDLINSDASVSVDSVALALQRRNKFTNGYRSYLVYEDGRSYETSDFDALEESTNSSLTPVEISSAAQPVVFLFPGQGSEYEGMCGTLTSALFHQYFQSCAELFSRPITIGKPEKSAYGSCTATFCASYAMAKSILTISGTAQPRALIGHSLGEWCAAAVAGVVSLEDAVKVVEKRAEICDKLGGVMLAVGATKSKTLAICGEHSNLDFDIACVNSQRQTVLAADEKTIDALVEIIKAQGVRCKKLSTYGAFHSRFLDEHLDDFRSVLESVELKKPVMPIISTATGSVLSPERAMDIDYWIGQLRNTVQFFSAVQTAKNLYSDALLVEVGPGNSLSSLAEGEVADLESGTWTFASTFRRKPRENSDESIENDDLVMLAALGELWNNGMDPSLPLSHSNEDARLPPFPFNRQRIEIDNNKHTSVKKVGFFKQGLITTALEDNPNPETLIMETRYQLSEPGYRAFAVCDRPIEKWALYQNDTPFAGCGELKFALAHTSGQFVDSIRKSGLGVFYAAGLDSDDANFGKKGTEVCDTVLSIARELLHAFANGLKSIKAFWLIVPPSPVYFGVRALARSIALEHPELKIRFAFYDGSGESSNFDRLERALVPSVFADEIAKPFYECAILNDQLFLPALLPSALQRASSIESWSPKADELYIISGGHRGIGLALAERLVKTGARNLVLIGRSLPNDESALVLQNLEDVHSAKIHSFAVDVTNIDAFAQFENDVKELLEQSSSSSLDGSSASTSLKLGGVYHCAGVVDDAVVLKQTLPRVKFVLDPKIVGAKLLSQLIDNLDSSLRCNNSFLLLFSSTASVFGTAGQSTYAFANGCLDGFALQRNQQGKRTMAVQWGGWGEVGMSIDLGVEPVDGERYLRPTDAFSALDILLHQLTQDSFIDSYTKETLAFPAVTDIFSWVKYMTHETLFFPNDSICRHLALLEMYDTVSNTSHPVLGEFRDLGAAKKWENDSWSEVWSFAKQHQFDNSPVFPGTAYVELCCQVANEYFTDASKWQLTNVAFMKALPLVSPRKIQVFATQTSKSEPVSVKISSQAYGEGDDEVWVVHCTATIEKDKVPFAKEQFPYGAGFCTIAPQLLYDNFEDGGFSYGPLFQRVIGNIALAQNNCATVLCDRVSNFSASEIGAASPSSQLLPTEVDHSTGKFGRFHCHPADLDAFTHVTSLLCSEGFGAVPIGLDRIRLFNQDALPKCSRVQVEAKLRSDGSIDLWILDSDDDTIPFIVLEGMKFALFDSPALFAYRVTGVNTISPKLEIIPPPKKESSPLDDAVDKVDEQKKEESPARLSPVTTEASISSQSILNQSLPASNPFFRCEPCVEPPVIDAFPQVEERSPSPEPPQPQIEAAAKNLLPIDDHGMPDNFYESISHGILSRKMFPSANGETSQEFREYKPECSAPYTVEIDPASGIEGVHLAPKFCADPGPNEVQVLTYYWALNFRDVLVAMGVIPSVVAGKSLGIGGEAFGIVMKVGENVRSGIRPGSHVMATPPDGFGNFVNVDQRWVLTAPDAKKFSGKECVGMTMVYATAWLALVRLARVQEGDKVLIHSAAGGVGLSAVHICLAKGCEVYCTASTQEKRDYLMSLGAKKCFNSRNMEFIAGVKESVGGVDVVLNSLAGQAMISSMDLLNPFGRFIEIGKRDQYEHTKMDLAPFLKGCMYATAHLDVLMLEHPDRAHELLLECWRGILQYDLPALPTKTFGIAKVRDSLQYMSKGQHIGKVLVRMDYGEDLHLLPPNPKFLGFDLPRGARVQILHLSDDTSEAEFVLVDKISEHLRNLGAIVCDDFLSEEEEADLYGSVTLAFGGDNLMDDANAPGFNVVLKPCMGNLLPGVENVDTITAPIQAQNILTVYVPPLTLGGGSAGPYRRVSADDFLSSLLFGSVSSPLTNGDELLIAPAPHKLQRVVKKWRSFLTPDKSHLRSDDASSQISRIDFENFMFVEVAKLLDIDVNKVSGTRTFEEQGVDSLSLVGLARKASRFIGRVVPSVVFLDHPTIEKVLDFVLVVQDDNADNHMLTSAAATETSSEPPADRKKVLCLHGYRTSGDLMAHQARSISQLLEPLGYELIFLDAPNVATGPGPQGLEGMEQYEWYSRADGTPEENSYLNGWWGPSVVGLDKSIQAIRQHAPFEGIIGFSQGGGMATFVAQEFNPKWLMLFSPVCVPGIPPTVTCPMYLAWDINSNELNISDQACVEPWLRMIKIEKQKGDYGYDTVLANHDDGHSIPSNLHWCKKFLGQCKLKILEPPLPHANTV